ncbi:MAG TPA: DUF1656 domain-containing protein [Chthoniobacterales bacterium]|jgi:hypothetical protein
MPALTNADIEFFGTFVPWWMMIGVFAYLLAWLVVRVLEHAQLTRYIWHLPLFFLALVVLFYSAIGLVLAP